MFTGPYALTVSITKNTESSSIVVQWDAVDDFLTTTYTITWTSERDHNLQSATLNEQSSYTITGLTLDTVYSITVIAANKCGHGPEIVTRMSFTADTTSTTSSISPTVTASTNSMTIMSTANPNTATTTDITSTGTAITYSTTATTFTIQLSTTTTIVKMYPSTTTTISMTTTVSRDTDTTSSTTKTTNLMITTSSMNPSTTVITYPTTTTVTSIGMFPTPTGNPADDTSKFSSTCS